jgi:tetratricopeptide (TPR) repeat protein
MEGVGARGLRGLDGHQDIFTRLGLDQLVRDFFLVVEVGALLSGKPSSDREPCLLFAAWLLCVRGVGPARPPVNPLALWEALRAADAAYAGLVLPGLHASFSLLSAAGEPRLRPYSGPPLPSLRDPEAFAYSLGHHARTYGEYGDAERFLRWSIAAAEARKNHQVHADARVALGKVFRYRGIFDRARKHLQTAIGLAEHHRLRVTLARALYDLSTIAIELEDGTTAYALAGRALKLYDSDDVDRIHLVADVGYLWTQQGNFAPAVTILCAVLPHLHADELRMLVGSTAARAAACGGMEETAIRYASEAWKLSAALPRSCRTAQTYLNLAYAAHARGAWDEAWRAASHALALAAELGEVDVEREAAPLLDQAAKKEGVRYFSRAVSDDVEAFAAAVVRMFAVGEARAG